MKRITNEEYLLLHEMIIDKIVEISRHGYSKYADMAKIQADTNKLEVLRSKIEERIKDEN